MKDFTKEPSLTREPTSRGQARLKVVEDVDGSGFAYSGSYTVDIQDASGAVMTTREVDLQELVSIGVLDATDIQAIRNALQKLGIEVENRIIGGAS